MGRELRSFAKHGVKALDLLLHIQIEGENRYIGIFIASFFKADLFMCAQQMTATIIGEFSSVML